MFEKLNITERLKNKQEDSILEHTLKQLEVIREKKNWTKQEIGENFPLLIAPDVAIDEDIRADEEAKSIGKQSSRRSRPAALQIMM